MIITTFVKIKKAILGFRLKNIANFDSCRVFWCR